MAAIKAPAAERFLQKPPAACRGVLLYGSDPGQIASCAERLSQVWQKAEPGVEVLKLHDADLARAPDRIATELSTPPMFNTARILWLVAPPAATHGAIIEAIAAPPIAWLIVQAPDAKKSSKMAQAFEAQPYLAAIPCYGETRAALLAYAKDELQREGYQPDADALSLLIERTGLSRPALDSTLAKLIAYAGDERRIAAADVEAIGEDQSQSGFDDVIESALDGKPADMLANLDRCLAAGGNVSGLISVFLSRLMRLSALRAAIDAGEPAAQAVARLRPPVFFRQQDALIRQGQNLDAKMLASMIRKLSEAMAHGRLKPNLTETIAAQVMLGIAKGAEKTQRSEARGRGASPSRRF
jgi:DNA polymerase-3 subunit delta